jgi:hypothetical protein
VLATQARRPHVTNTNIAERHVVALSPPTASIPSLVARPHTRAHTYTHLRHGRGDALRLDTLLTGVSPAHPQECEHAVRIPPTSPWKSSPPALTRPVMQPQQQLSQIEKSVTHLLVATKQLLGPFDAPKDTHRGLLTLPRNLDVMVARDRHRERSFRRLCAPGL